MKSRIVEIVDFQFAKPGQKLFTSLEGLNPGRSIKDHMVKGELEYLFNQKTIKKRDWISDVSSGSTAMSLAYYCHQYSLECHIFVPKDTEAETLDFLKKHQANIHPSDRNEIYQDHAKFLSNYQCHYFNQLENPKLSRHYSALAESFLERCQIFDLVIGAVGTGHSLKGVSGAIIDAIVMSAEPRPNEFCLGVRNIESERYGEHDSCRIEDFQRRIIVPRSEFISQGDIQTDLGAMKIGESFRLVLSSLKILQKDKIHNSQHINILLLGSSNTL